MKTFLKAFSTKLTLVMLALASLATSAMAEVKLSFEDISLFIGKSAPVTILMDNDETGITNLQFDLTLPENLTLDESSIALGARSSATQSVQMAQQPNGAFRFVITDAQKTGFSGTSGAVVTFNVTANAALAEDAALTLSEITAVAKAADGKITGTATPGLITVMSEETVSFEADETAVTIVDGKAQIAISMNNGMALVGVQGNITLPEGLTVESITPAERATGLTATFKAETGKFTLTSTDNTLISGNSGTLFYINLVAGTGLAETSEVTIQNFVASTPRAKALRPTDVITVTVNYEAAPVIPEVVLNAPTFNAQPGTQAEPNMLAEGEQLKITFTAENLEENELSAADLKVKVKVMASGDLPENVMSMASPTAHRVLGQDFYIDLGETDFPVELKEGYVYQNIAVLAASLVKPGATPEEDVVVATYAGAPIMLPWIGVPIDSNKAYEAALTAIVDGSYYRIFTEVNGEKYYVTEAGKLSATADEGGIFAFTKVTGGAFKEYGFKIDSGSKRFTNPPLANNVANLNPGAFATTTGNRNDWEAQVLFFFNDKFAIRSCNTAPATSSWGDAGRTYWTYAVEGVTPQYTYDQVYLWQIEGPLTPIQVTYELYEADGTTKVSSATKKQEANSEVSAPADMISHFAYTYTYEGTIGDADCTIKITRTFKEGVVHALADLSNAKAYTIRCDRGALLTKDDYLASTAHSSLTNAEAADFAIINYEDNYYIFSVADQKFVTNNGALAEMPSHGAEDAIKMTPQTDPYFLYNFTVGGTNLGLNTNGNDPYGYVINTWMNADPGNQYYMVESADFDPAYALAALNAYFHATHHVIYVVKDAEGKELFRSDAVPAIEGSTITTLPADYQRVFTRYNEVEIPVTEEETIAEFTATWDGPFAVFTDFDEARWYNMTIRGDYYVAKDETEPYYPKADKDIWAWESQWAFAGNAYEGIRVYNKAVGEGSTLTKDGDNVVLREGDYAWEIGQNADGFTLKEIGTDYNCINQAGGATGPLGFWNSGNAPTDNGSTFRVNAVPVVRVFNINVDRYVGMGYATTVADASEALAAAMQHLGVTELSENMLDIVKPDGTVEFNWATYDGWFNGECYPETWGANTKINVKFFEAIPDGEFSICDMNGADVVGQTYTVTWELQANGRAVWFKVNVTFVEAPSVEIEISENVIQTSVTYGCAEASYVEKSIALTDEQVAAICTELGIASLADADVFGYNPTTQELVSNFTGFDGWRDANGDFHNWSGNAEVPACVKYTDGKTYLCYNINGVEPQTIKCYWAIATETKAVLVEISFIYSEGDGVNGIDADHQNAVIYDLSGRKIQKIQRGGVYIINGKKVAIK